MSDASDIYRQPRDDSDQFRSLSELAPWEYAGWLLLQRQLLYSDVKPGE